MYKLSGRYDLLNKFYQASGRWSKVYHDNVHVCSVCVCVCEIPLTINKGVLGNTSGSLGGTISANPGVTDSEGISQHFGVHYVSNRE